MVGCGVGVMSLSKTVVIGVIEDDSFIFGEREEGKYGKRGRVMTSVLRALGNNIEPDSGRVRLNGLFG